MSSNIQPVPGMSDLATPEIMLWQMLEQRARRVLTRYGFTELRTPLVEKTELFVRSIGDTTDVVQKEMYTFEDRGGRSLSLRPEGTASVIRHIAGGGPEALQSRVYYSGAMFRAERPQAGRKRQFHQIGAEALGAPSPAADAECIALQHDLLSTWGLKNFSIRLNTRGTPEDREQVAAGLRSVLEPQLGLLCDDCQRRYNENVLRILDCKNEKCRKIVSALPAMTTFMSEEALWELSGLFPPCRQKESLLVISRLYRMSGLSLRAMRPSQRIFS